MSGSWGAEPLLEERLHRPDSEEVKELQPASAANLLTDELSAQLLHHVPGVRPELEVVVWIDLI